MTIELWVDKGVLIRCENPASAFDNKEMKRNFNMARNAVFIDSYDCKYEAHGTYKVLAGEIKASEFLTKNSWSIVSPSSLDYFMGKMQEVVKAIKATAVSRTAIVAHVERIYTERTFESDTEMQQFKTDYRKTWKQEAKNLGLSDECPSIITRTTRASFSRK